jgi:hypothetical protein
MRPWWEVFEGRLELELREFERLAQSYDLAAGPEQGHVIVRARFDSRAGTVDAVVLYPDSFPFLRPLVLAPELRLAHHQNPFGKNLCLLDRDTRQWHPQRDSAASHIAEQLDKLIVAVEGTADERAAVETPQAEPVSAFIVNEPGAVVLIPDDALELGSEERGELRLQLLGRAGVDAPLRALLAEVATKPARGPKRRLARRGDDLRRLDSGETLTGRWLRIDLRADNAPPEATADAFVEFGRNADAEWVGPQYQRVAGGEAAVLALVYDEEVLGRERQTAWLFVVRVRGPLPPDGRVGVKSYVVKGQRLGRDDVGARIPELVGLRDKKVAVVGLGALGAPLALELARAQVGELRLLDWDEVEVGNSVRWPLGLSAAGFVKTDALAGFLRANYPLTKLMVINHQIGMPTPESRSERQILTELLAGADLIVGVTAEYGIDHLLTYLAAEAGLPQIYAWGTPGYWGGGVARVLPGGTGCWYCLKRWHEEQGESRIPTAPHDPAELVQPPGCAAATATGASFDLAPVVAQAARVAAQTLVAGADGGYPRADGDVMIVSLRTEEGPLSAPNWQTFRLEQHPDCPYCRSLGEH